MYSLQFGYILYSLPPLVTSLMFVIFKLRKLLGVIQKFILSIMFIDLSYTSPSNIRDIILRVSQMHYGFKEYLCGNHRLFSCTNVFLCHFCVVEINNVATSSAICRISNESQAAQSFRLLLTT